MKYFLELMYEGTAYAGWQKQPNATGIQAVLEDRIGRILGEEIPVTGCGRTDKGVHARQYFIHLETRHHLDEAFLFRINNFLPADISVLRVIPVAEDAHARFDASERKYTYHVLYQKDPFQRLYSFYYQKAADYSTDKMNRFCEKLMQYNDFQSFSKFHSDVHHFRCNLMECRWQTVNTGMTLHITSDRFLRGMVRLIVGACLRYAEGKIKLKDLEQAMATGEQIKASWSVPGQGLFLDSIKYPYL